MGSIHSVLCIAADEQYLYAVAFEYGQADGDIVLLRSPSYPDSLSSNKWDIVKRGANDFIPSTERIHHYCAASRGAFLILSDSNETENERFRGFLYDPVSTKGEFQKVHAGSICEDEDWCQASVLVVPRSSPPRFSMFYYHESFDAIRMASFDNSAFTFGPTNVTFEPMNNKDINIHNNNHKNRDKNDFNKNNNKNDDDNNNNNYYYYYYLIQYYNRYNKHHNSYRNRNLISTSSYPNTINSYSKMVVLTTDSAINPKTNETVPRVTFRVFEVDERGLPVRAALKNSATYLLPTPCTNQNVVDRFGRVADGALYYWCNGSNGTMYTIEDSSISDPLKMEPWSDRTPEQFVLAPTRGDSDPDWALVTDTWGSIFGVHVDGSDAGELLQGGRPTVLSVSLSTGSMVYLGFLGLMVLAGRVSQWSQETSG
ncbi:hypothetical protein DFQ26_006668 [Actinomortierella ambigua]|nr:hypothetical protein DFQ26_006668 [Actinomortierella ambigua]